jgi:(S)-3,5-dihydroxyphenylglycine transaminase
MPGVRVGFIALPNKEPERHEIARELAKVKSYVSVMTANLPQAMVGGFLLEQDFRIDTWNRERVELCRENRNTMATGLTAHFGDSAPLAGQAAWREPGGGFFFSLSLRFPFGREEFLQCAQLNRVLVLPISFFSLSNHFDNCVRLAYCNVSNNVIVEGLQRFSKFLERTANKRV